MKKSMYTILCCLLVFMIFSGCASEKQTYGRIIKCDAPGGATNLDPQFATEDTARLVIANIGEGLLKRDINGNLVPGVAESYTVSPDGKRLVFKLRDDAYWEDGSPVTADDFVFAFRRMFAWDSPSPHAGDYIAIDKAREILEQTTSIEGLGVVATGEKELEIRLAHPSPYFPESLAETPAVPCNREFFKESRGRYGLETAFVNSNGPFRLERWDTENDQIYLRPNSSYSEQPAFGGVNILCSAENTFERISGGDADIGVGIDFDEAEKLRAQGFTVSYYDKTVWCVVFNQNSEIWGNPLLRQGLSKTIERDLLKDNLPEKFTPTDVLIPSAGLLAGHKYRENVDPTPVKFDTEQGRRLFEMGLSALEIETLSEGSFYVPDSAGHLLAMGAAQKSWQKHLSAYINVEPATAGEIRQRFLTGDYSMLLMPITMSGPQSERIFDIFAEDSSYNHFGYHNAFYSGLLKMIPEAQSLSEAAEACARVESLLLQDAVVIPVYTETTAFVAASDIEGVRSTAFFTDLLFAA